MPTPIHAHLRACISYYLERDVRPIVALDALAARRFAELCWRLLEHVGGMSEEQARASLIEHRKLLRKKTLPDGDGWAFMGGIWHSRELDVIVDPIAYLRDGWIEVSMAKEGLPRYCRMLEINHPVSSITRGDLEHAGESDDQWLQRRRTWLQRYNPEVPVKQHYRGPTGDGEEDAIARGTVGTFIEQAHMREWDLHGLRGWRTRSLEYDMVDVLDWPQPDGAVATACVTPPAGQVAPQAGSCVDVGGHLLRIVDRPRESRHRERERAA